MCNLLKAWDFFKWKLTLPNLSTQDFQLVDIWVDPQVTLSGEPLQLISIASKHLQALGLISIADSQDSNATSWQRPQQLFDTPLLRLQTNCRQLVAKLRMSNQFVQLS